jgi:chemotaxis protein methyltransferase CheR
MMENTAQQEWAGVPPRITEIEFAKFCEYFYQRTGILFDEKKRYVVERHLKERFAETNSATFRDYFRLLRFDASGVEMQAVVNLLTINETYFFREDYQFQALVDGVLPELVRSRPASRTISIWSMPCSTGEEPYSIALYILEKWAKADAYAIEIHASDIDSRVLDEARAGIYGERSLQRLSPEIKAKYFTKQRFNQSQICLDLRESIAFSSVNITVPADLRPFRNIDVIFCRNMLIYFDDVSRRIAAEALYECMAPGGFICLGHSESMSRISSLFRPRKFADTIIYQKPFAAE